MNKDPMGYRAGIVGYRGYSGAELLRLLNGHSHITPVLLDHREATPTQAVRGAVGPERADLGPQTVQQQQLAVVFLATPPEASMELAPMLIDAGARVIDLSGAFRLGTPENYTAWYKATHTAPDLLREAVYGLPEFCRDGIARA